jgi:small basic protein
MWVALIVVLVGLSVGLFVNIPIALIGTKYLALIFLAVLDSLTYGLGRDASGIAGTNNLVILRLLASLMFGGFIIYFGEKSGMDLYLVALLPIALGLSLNLYKFLPK